MPDTLSAPSLSLRQRLAAELAGDSRAGSIRQNLVRGLLGTAGLPGDEQPSIADFVPPSSALFGADEAGRAADQNNFGTAAMDALSIIPAVGPAARALRMMPRGAMTPEAMRKLARDAVAIQPEHLRAALQQAGWGPQGHAVDQVMEAHALEQKLKAEAEAAAEKKAASAPARSPTQ